jgi:hypothetical protein
VFLVYKRKNVFMVFQVCFLFQQFQFHHDFIIDSVLSEILIFELILVPKVWAFEKCCYLKAKTIFFFQEQSSSH